MLYSGDYDGYSFPHVNSVGGEPWWNLLTRIKLLGKKNTIIESSGLKQSANQVVTCPSGFNQTHNLDGAWRVYGKNNRRKNGNMILTYQKMTSSNLTQPSATVLYCDAPDVGVYSDCYMNGWNTTSRLWLVVQFAHNGFFNAVAWDGHAYKINGNIVSKTPNCNRAANTTFNLEHLDFIRP